MADHPQQTWELVVGGHAHLVEVRGGGLGRQVTWFVDGVEVAARRSGQDKLTLTAAPGRLEVRHSGLGKARRATFTAPGAAEVDLVPEPGSPAASYEDRVREHPTRTSLLAAAGAVAGLVVPILPTLLLARFAVSLPWPDLPSLPSPDLPSPDLPSIPWPDVSLPGWVRSVLDQAPYVWPVVLALVLARAEVRRRRRQDELRRR